MIDCKTCEHIIAYDLDKGIAKDHIINLVKLDKKQEALLHMSYLMNVGQIEDKEHNLLKNFYKHGFYKVELKNERMVKLLEEHI